MLSNPQYDALRRIPPQARGRVTFFSDWDLWLYELILDDRLCSECAGHASGMFQGSHIRLLFPYLEIVDEDLIDVLVHPNCRCELRRVGGYQEFNFGQEVSW